MKFKIVITKGSKVELETTVEAPTILIAVHGVTNILAMLDDPTELTVTAAP